MARALRTRNWRRRGRRGQVAAVATLLGLLLVVTFIANFLTTVVPNQMQVNDLNHETQVENQLGRLAALLSSAGAQGSVGTQIVQPISLGSDSVPPWVAQDSASVGSGEYGSTSSLSFGLLGALVYSPWAGPPQGGPALPAGCSFTSGTHVGIACTAALTTLAYNFSGNAKAFTVTSTLATGLYALNYSTNHSTISISATLGAKVDLGIYGSNDSVTLSVLGGSSINVTLEGNNDYLNLGATGTAGVVVRSYGSVDSLYQSSASAGKMLVISYGNADSITANATAAMAYTAYVTGFNATDPASKLCPYDNVSMTEGLHGTGATATYTAYFNNTQYTGVFTSAPWTVHDQVVAPTTCPLFARQQIQLKSPSVPGTGPLVLLHNLYAPNGEVAYDEGAVVYAQYGAYPVFVDKPSIGVVVPGGVGTPVTAASIWLPFFSNVVGSVSGVGTQTVDLRVLHTQLAVINATSPTYAVNPLVPISLVIHTPYAEAWDAYLNGALDFSGLWSCAPVLVCTGVYEQGGPLGTVTITIPTSSLSLMKVGSTIFSFSLT